MPLIVPNRKPARRPNRFRLNTRHPLADRLVFAGLGSLPGTGHYHNSAAFSPDGTLENMAGGWGYAAELGRPKVYFAGSTDRIKIPGPPAWLTGLSSFTFACWVNYASGANSTFDAPFVADPLATYKILCAFQSDNKLRFYVRTASGATDCRGVATISGGAGWGHAVYRYDSSLGSNRLRLFVNGEQDGGKNGYAENVTDATSDAYLGCYYNSVTSGPTIDMADAMFWTRALTDAEIALLADRSDPMLGGLIVDPSKHFWPVVSGGSPATSIPVMIHDYKMSGGL